MKIFRTIKRAPFAGIIVLTGAAIIFTASKGQPDDLTGQSEEITAGTTLIMARKVPGSKGRKKDTAPAEPGDMMKKIAGVTPGGWKIYDRVKVFTPASLYEQINGRAEFFIAYDVIRASFATFIKSSNKEQFIDLSIYDMGSPDNAFGVFSAERSEGGAPLAIGRAGYIAEGNCYVWKGQYYIRVIASDGSGKLKRAGVKLARKAAGFLSDTGEPVWGLTALPGKDRVSGSVKYFKVDAMGLDFMKNTYIARYRKGNRVITAFISKRESPETVRDAVDRYTKHAKRYGKGFKRVRVDGVNLAACDMDGSYDVVFQKGRLMGGVFSVKDRSLAVRAAADLWKRLKDR